MSQLSLSTIRSSSTCPLWNERKERNGVYNKRRMDIIKKITSVGCLHVGREEKNIYIYILYIQ